MNLEHNTMINIDTVAHMNMHYTQDWAHWALFIDAYCSHHVTSWLKLSSPRHPIHACPFVRCVVVVLFTRLLFFSVLLLFFQTFQMSSSEFHEKFKSKNLRDFRLGTVATTDHETPLTPSTCQHYFFCQQQLSSVFRFPLCPSDRLLDCHVLYIVVNFWDRVCNLLFPLLLQNSLEQHNFFLILLSHRVLVVYPETVHARGCASPRLPQSLHLLRVWWMASKSTVGAAAEPDSDTDSVVCVWEDDHDEDPAHEDDRVEPSHGVAVNRVDHNHEDPPFPEVHQAVPPAVIPNMVLSESASSMSDSERPSEDDGPSEAGSEVEPKRHSVCQWWQFCARLFSCWMVSVWWKRCRTERASWSRCRGSWEEITNRHEDSFGGDLCRRTHREEARAERGWKLFIFLPRMLLPHPARGGPIPRAKLISRFESFVRGDWGSLILASRECSTQAVVVRRRRSRRGTMWSTGQHGLKCWCTWESCPQQDKRWRGQSWLRGLATRWNTLQDQSRRPRDARVPVPPPLANFRPRVPFALDGDMLARNLRPAKRGASGGPSGMIVEHVHPLLDHTRDSQLFFQAADRPSRKQWGRDASQHWGNWTVEWGASLQETSWDG